jgi:hypothetical protein
MSEITATTDLRAKEAAAQSPRGKTFADNALVQLTLVRFREFTREPEALFWVFIFPVLLAAGLGIAFRNRPAEILKIAAVTPELTRSLQQDKLLDVVQLDTAAGEEALRTGKVALLAVPGSGGTVIYRYDDTNPEGRTARMLADRAVQQAAGRVDPVSTSDVLMREPGSRYIDFLIPGLLGMNLMGSAIWGAPGCDADAEIVLLDVVPAFAIAAACGGSHRAAGVRRAGVSRARSRIARRACAALRAGFALLQRAWIADCVARPNDRSRVGADEHSDAADVDCVRRVFLGAAISGCCAAIHQGAAADRGD